MHSAKTDVATTLLASIPLRRAQEHLHDLIIIAYENLSKTRGNSLSLVRCQYVSGENNGGKFSMHLDLLVKVLELNENVTMQLQFAVSNEDAECYQL